MAPAFPIIEYENRVNRVREVMIHKGMDALIIGEPSNINWITGYDAWSFYTPQLLLLGINEGPFWMGREMDSGAAEFTTYLKPSQVIGYPEELVQREDVHPAEFLAGWMKNSGFGRSVIGYENDSYFFSPRSIFELKKSLTEVRWVEAGLLVNWVRLVKTEAEISMMRQAGKIAEIAMQTALDRTKVGARQNDIMSEVVSAQIKGTDDYGGDITALHPLILAGEAATTAHPMWTDKKLEAGQTIAFEVGGCRKRYNVGLARTVHLGRKKPRKLIETAKAVQEGMAAVMDTLRANVSTANVHASWQKVLDRYGLEKKSRIGYSIGVGYPPDWGEHTLSFRANNKILVPENAVVHIILGMWMHDWGMELSETLHVRSTDCVRLSNFPQKVHWVE